MYLWHVFLVRPFAALSVLICLAAILSCWSVLRKPVPSKLDRFLIAFVGLLSVYQGFRILRDCGLLVLPTNAGLNDAVELLITAFYLMATLILRLARHNWVDADYALRLAMAAPPSPPVVAQQDPASTNPGEIREVLSWALPRLSDGAFKLYAYLHLHADQASGKAVVKDKDLLLNCGRTEAEEAAHFGELLALGASVVQRQDDEIVVQVNAPALSKE